MSLDEALAKAVGEVTKESPSPEGQESGNPEQTPSNESVQTQEGESEVQQPEAESKEPEGGEKKPPKNPEKWDGVDVTKLPEALQEYARKVQRYTKEKEAEAAELRKKQKEYETRFPAETMAQFEQWRAAQQNRPINQTPETEQPLITAEMWEEALLDTSGKKVNEVVGKIVESRIQQAEQKYAQTIGRLEQREATVDWTTKISEFAEIHGDFKELHEAGIIKPILKAYLKDGLPAQEALESAYAEAQKVASHFEAKALAKSQGRVNEKKNGVTFGKTPPSKTDTVWVSDPSEVLERQIEAAMNKQNVKVKVRPNK